MASYRRERFLYGQAIWMLTTLVGLEMLGALSLELYFVVSLIGFLVVVEFTAPFNITPQWRARLKWIVLAGILGFGYILLTRILRSLPAGTI